GRAPHRSLRARPRRYGLPSCWRFRASALPWLRRLGPSRRRSPSRTGQREKLQTNGSSTLFLYPQILYRTNPAQRNEVRLAANCLAFVTKKELGKSRVLARNKWKRCQCDEGPCGPPSGRTSAAINPFGPSPNLTSSV